MEEEKIKIWPGDIYETICSTREPIPLPNDGMDHHAKSQGEHGEVDLVQTDTKVSDDPGCNGGCDDPGNESQGYGRIDVEQHEAGDIGPDAEEGSMSKGKKPCIPEKKIKTDGEENHDEHLGEKNHEEAR